MAKAETRVAKKKKGRWLRERGGWLREREG
jgi:hypothetical protein